MSAETNSALITAFLENREMLRRTLVARAGADAAEDLLQELYLKIRQVDPAQPIANANAYLYRLTFNLIIDIQRSGVRRWARDDRWHRDAAVVRGGADLAPTPGAEQALAAKQDLAKVMSALSKLPQQTQRVFRLHKFEELSYRETASALGISISAVEKHMSRALKRLILAVEQ